MLFPIADLSLALPLVKCEEFDLTEYPPLRIQLPLDSASKLYV